MGVFLVEFLKGAVVQRLTDALHQAVVEIQVVLDGQTHTQHLARLQQVADIAAGILTAGGAVALLVDGTGIVGILVIDEVAVALPGEHVAVAGVAAGHDAVEQVHATVYRL